MDGVVGAAVDQAKKPPFDVTGVTANRPFSIDLEPTNLGRGITLTGDVDGGESRPVGVQFKVAVTTQWLPAGKLVTEDDPAWTNLALSPISKVEDGPLVCRSCLRWMISSLKAVEMGRLTAEVVGTRATASQSCLARLRWATPSAKIVFRRKGMSPCAVNRSRYRAAISGSCRYRVWFATRTGQARESFS